MHQEDRGRTVAPVPAYEITVKGTASPRLAAAFDDMEVSSFAGHTVLRGHLVDQAALRGLLDRIAALHLDVVDLRRLPPAEAWEPA
jgi:hypothetical protein